MSSYSITMAENYNDVKWFLQICTELLINKYNQIPSDEVNLYSQEFNQYKVFLGRINFA